MIYLIPQPQQWTFMEGSCTIAYDGRITVGTSCKEEGYRYARLIKKELEEYAGFGLAVTRGASKKTVIALSVDEKLKEQEYCLRVEKAGIFLTGGDGAGLLYAVQTLRQIIRQAGACIPCMNIRDYPDIPVRGLYYDVTRGRIPTLEYLKKLADQISFYKMNQLQLYIEHSFQFENLSEVWRDDTPLTAEELLALDAYCNELHIELVPSLACFGHLYKVLRTKTLGHLCELPDADKQPFGFVDRMEHHTLDASNPDSLALVKSWIEEYLPLFSSSYFNIGADETFDLGKGRSRELAKKEGTQRIYMDFLKKLCEFVVSKGKKPMFWADIICGFPDAMKELPKEAVCLNWGYEQFVSDESVKKLAEAGAVQYCCPGVSGWDQFVNRLRVSYDNCKRMCSYAGKYGAAGVLTTDWGDCGHINHPDLGTAGRIYGAAFSWNNDIPEYETMNRRISRLELQDESESFLDLAGRLSDCWVFTWRDCVNFVEHRCAAPTASELSGAADCLKELGDIRQGMYELLPGLAPGKRSVIRPYLSAIRGMELLQKVGVALSAGVYHTEQLLPVDCKALAGELEEWFCDYKELWRSVGKEAELYRVQAVVYWYADYLRELGKAETSGEG